MFTWYNVIEVIIVKEYVKGKFTRSIFRGNQGFLIGIMRVYDTNMDSMKAYVNKSVTFTGTFSDLNEENLYLFYGDTVEHPRYGFQLQVREYELVKPEDRDGIIAFLSSSLFKGIGERMATKIVETLGDTALDQILEDSSCLNMVPGLSSKKAQSLYETLYHYEGSHKTIVYLTDLGFTMRDALNIYQVFQQNTITRLEFNIFDFIPRVDGITFPKVDVVRRKLNVSDDDERRVKACILYVIEQLVYQNGDTYVYREEILKGCSHYLGDLLTLPLLEEYLQVLLEEDLIYMEDDMIYDINMYEAEMTVVDTVHKLISKDKKRYPKMDSYLEHMEMIQEITYNDKQKEAIRKALENHILIVTGGPGTGKTTIIKAIVELYAEIHKLNSDELIRDLALLAPTGRASKRMSESTALPAMTIHRFLKWNKETNEFAINEYNKDNSKLIIVDEVSMIDLPLLSSLLKGLTSKIQLVLVGDFNQLPSVGPGQVLKDFIESGVIDTVALDHLYRQDENSYINTLALKVKDNDLDEHFLDDYSDYKFLQCSNHSIRQNLKNLCVQIKEKNYDYKQLQIMAPMYKGENGIDLLNKDLQEVFNPSSNKKKEYVSGDVIYRVGDKILQLVNMPDDNVYNGDVGVLQDMLVGRGGKVEIYVNFDGNLVCYTPKDFHKIKHGFIISIHKSQGSEFELVVMPISKSYHRMLYRKLVYTGITRAKKKLILLGDPEAFIYSVRNDNEYIRKTNLKNKLCSFE